MTEFQLECLRGCLDLTRRRRALEWTDFHAIAATDKVYYTARIRGPRHKMKVNIYENKADLSLDGREMVFDDSEYKSIDELKRAFLGTLAEAIQSIGTRIGGG
jgi:hypothetical protein